MLEFGGSGSFGSVYPVMWNNRNMIIKKMRIVSPSSDRYLAPEKEINVLNDIKENQRFPKMYNCVYEIDKYNEINVLYIFMDRFESNLLDKRVDFI